jgi:hypothetical protein
MSCANSGDITKLKQSIFAPLDIYAWDSNSAPPIVISFPATSTFYPIANDIFYNKIVSIVNIFPYIILLGNPICRMCPTEGDAIEREFL